MSSAVNWYLVGLAWQLSVCFLVISSADPVVEEKRYLDSGHFNESSSHRIGVNFVPAVQSRNMAEEEGQKKSEEGPKNFRYVHLWVSEDGETHIKETKMSGFTKQVYSSALQFVRDNFGGQPEKIVFTELSVGLEQPLHTPPQVQFVVTLAGSWYVKTTDGTKHVFKPGDVLFQDNTKNTPAKRVGEHYSGNVGDVPCQQLVVQLNRPPEVDDPTPF